MTYLDDARDALAYELPGLHPELLDLYTLLVHVKGEQVTHEDVHDAWGLWTLRARPDHASLIPFSELAPEVQELDGPYVDAIKMVAAKLQRST